VNCANLSRSDWLINSQTYGPRHSSPGDEKEAVGRKQVAKEAKGCIAGEFRTRSISEPLNNTNNNIKTGLSCQQKSTQLLMVFKVFSSVLKRLKKTINILGFRVALRIDGLLEGEVCYRVGNRPEHDADEDGVQVNKHVEHMYFETWRSTLLEYDWLAVVEVPCGNRIISSSAEAMIVLLPSGSEAYN